MIQSRRKFLKSTASTYAATALAGAAAGGAIAEAISQTQGRNAIRLGMDNFSVRAMKWKSPQLIDYAASLNLDTLFITDLDALESLEESHLVGLKEQAVHKGLAIYFGGGSICPTSRSFNPKHGSAEDYLALLIRIAKALGSPAARCVLGSSADRLVDGGIDRQIENTVKVCRSARSLAIDSNVKIAIENHAGDMQSWELVQLIEAAGRDYVGANMDSGNAVWTLEDPMRSLEILGPYAVTTSLRDSAAWEDESGAILVAWTDTGDGQIDWPAYVKRLAELCPGVPFQIETISGGGPRKFAYLDSDFWKPYPKARAADLAHFIAYAKRGKPYQAPADRPSGERSTELEQRQQKYDIERSVRFCRETLKIGTR